VKALSPGVRLVIKGQKRERTAISSESDRTTSPSKWLRITAICNSIVKVRRRRHGEIAKADRCAIPKTGLVFGTVGTLSQCVPLNARLGVKHHPKVTNQWTQGTG
jgi:hypothetical protein